MNKNIESNQTSNRVSQEFDEKRPTLMMSAEANFTVKNPRQIKKVNQSQIVPKNNKKLSLDILAAEHDLIDEDEDKFSSFDNLDDINNMLDELDVVKFTYRDEIENPRLKLIQSDRDIHAQK